MRTTPGRAGPLFFFFFKKKKKKKKKGGGEKKGPHGAGTADGAGATPTAVVRLLALADGTGVEAVLDALARLRAAGSA